MHSFVSVPVHFLREFLATLFTLIPGTLNMGLHMPLQIDFGYKCFVAYLEHEPLIQIRKFYECKIEPRSDKRDLLAINVKIELLKII